MSMQAEKEKEAARKAALERAAAEYAAETAKFKPKEATEEAAGESKKQKKKRNKKKAPQQQEGVESTSEQKVCIALSPGQPLLIVSRSPFCRPFLPPICICKSSSHHFCMSYCNVRFSVGYVSVFQALCGEGMSIASATHACLLNLELNNRRLVLLQHEHQNPEQHMLESELPMPGSPLHSTTLPKSVSVRSRQGFKKSVIMRPRWPWTLTLITILKLVLMLGSLSVIAIIYLSSHRNEGWMESQGS